MSQVWRARDEVLGREVALKLLAAPGDTRPAPRSATVREARLAAGLSHPNLTQVYDWRGDAARRHPGAVPGDGVGRRREPGRPTGGRTTALAGSGPHREPRWPAPWPPPTRRRWCTGTSSPPTWCSPPPGKNSLDFGIAARCGARPERRRLVGTPTYAAPERLDLGPAQPEADVYSLGVLCYETLTGRPPMELPTWEHAFNARPGRGAAGRRGNRPAHPRWPRQGWQSYRERAGPGVPVLPLATSPADRPTADEVAGELTAAAAGRPVAEPGPRVRGGHRAPAPAADQRSTPSRSPAAAAVWASPWSPCSRR